MNEVFWDTNALERGGVLYDTGYTSPNVGLVAMAISNVFGNSPAPIAKITGSPVMTRVETVLVEFGDGRSIQFIADYLGNRFRMTAAHPISIMEIARPVKISQEQAVHHYGAAMGLANPTMADIEHKIESLTKRQVDADLNRKVADVWFHCDESGLHNFFHRPATKRAIANTRQAICYSRSRIELTAFLRQAKSFFV